MTEIPPTPPASLLVNETPLPLPIIPPKLHPNALPVQILTLPPGLAAFDQPITLHGLLQLVLNGKASFTTAQGEIMLNLPQLRGNPTLLQTIKQTLIEGQTLQLSLTPAPGGMPEARLIFPHALTRNPLLTSNPALTALIGQKLQAVILPKPPAPVTANATAEMVVAPHAQNSLPTAVTTRATPPTSSPNSGLPARLEQILRGFLASPETPAPPPSANHVLPLPQNPSAAQAVLNVKLLQIIPPGQPTPPPAADELLVNVPTPSGGAPVSLVTIGNTSLLLRTEAPLPVGGSLLLKLLPSALTGTQPDIATTAPSSTAWPQLQQLLEDSDLTRNPAWAQVVQQRVPQAQQAAALPGAMLFMLSALQSGDVRSWLGRTGIAALEQAEKREWLEALTSELHQNTGVTTDSVVGDWRVYHLPLFNQQQLQTLALYVHHNQQQQRGDDSTEPPPQKQTRFVIDVTFTQLGRMQLDGFVQQQQFDLVLRSHNSLTPALRDELRHAFTAALDATGYHGQMIFQPGGQNWLFLNTATHGNRKI